jgi:hypothetical protein
LKSLSTPSLWLVPALVLLAFVTYIPVLRQPFIEDDYPLIAQASTYGAVTGWGSAFRDPVNRPRMLSLFLLDTVHRFVGMNAAPYYVAGMCLHALNTLLVFALGAWGPIGYRNAGWSAGFFAVYEGHHEAIMWISANNELLLFLFGLASAVCWVHFLKRGRSSWMWYVLSILAFSLALLSKESAVIILPLLLLPAVWPDWRAARLMWLIPFALVTTASVVSILATRSYSGHFHDGSFAITAPFLRTWLNSYWRLFWIWGVVACAVLAFVFRRFPTPVRIGLVWAVLSLTPYIFLLYNSRVPSRHTYLASAGLALVVGSAFAYLADESTMRRWVPVIALAVIVQNGAWIWTRKRAQFLRRAEPTEQLISLARQTSGPIYIRCFPRNPVIADQAVRLSAGRAPSDLVWTAADAKSRGAQAYFCYLEK